MREIIDFYDALRAAIHLLTSMTDDDRKNMSDDWNYQYQRLIRWWISHGV